MALKGRGRQIDKRLNNRITNPINQYTAIYIVYTNLVSIWKLKGIGSWLGNIICMFSTGGLEWDKNI